MSLVMRLGTFCSNVNSRVVNALLTSIDALKTRQNCVVLTTSNLSTAIDDAFVDRADLVQYIGVPGPKAVRRILESCVDELLRTGIVNEDVDNDEMLDAVVEAAVKKGLSGRALRKVPFLTFVEVGGDGVGLREFCDAMKRVVEGYHEVGVGK